MPLLGNIKLICMDMDGTLFAANEQIPEINVCALRECSRRGIRTALVSGRNYRFLMQKACEISRDLAIVSANGARIDECAGGRCIYESCFKAPDAEKVNNVLWHTQVYYEIYTRDVNYAFRYEKIPKAHKRSLVRYIENRQVTECRILTDPKKAPNEGIYKFVAFSEEPVTIAYVQKAFDDMGIAHASSGSQNVETMAPGVDKGNALKVLCEHFGILRSDTMAFGDYTNDMCMLNASAHPVAMANAVDALKTKAEIIAPPNTQGGVGQVIYKYVLGADGEA